MTDRSTSDVHAAKNHVEYTLIQTPPEFCSFMSSGKKNSRLRKIGKINMTLYSNDVNRERHFKSSVDRLERKKVDKIIVVTAVVTAR